MKTKNIFRLFLTAVFVLGAMAMNAQTKVYVHQKSGTSDDYDIAKIDSISFNPLFIPPAPDGANMLVNPCFRIPADEDITNVDPWKPMTSAELLLDGTPGTPLPNNANYRITPSDAFWTNNASCLPSHHDGTRTYVGRLAATSSAGLYQKVNLTAGKTYAFRAYILHFKTATTQAVKTEYVRIKSDDGQTELLKVAIGTQENTWMEVAGTYTATSTAPVRFQISHYAGTNPNNTPATLIDDCEFYEVQ